MSVPFNISDHSIFFFAKGRPWDVPSDSPNFPTLKSLLTSGSPDVDQLIELADIRVSLAKQGLEITDEGIYYNGHPLHNAWVDKILLFREQGLPFDPIFNALTDLMKNPTPKAIERLPIFVERSKLGFLPDGRIACFKHVRSDYKDVHSGTVDWSPGSKPTMDREAVDADPDKTCSTGLHVGALDYIRSGAFPGGKRIVLVAVWPSDFVAVPVDYQGGKARVCAAEVLEEVEKSFVDEFLSQNQAVVKMPPKAGDWVRVEGSPFILNGEYELVAPYQIKLDTGTIVGVSKDCIVRVVPTPPAYLRAKVGDYVNTDYEGICRVVAIDPDVETRARLKVVTPDGERMWIDNDDVDEILSNIAFLQAKVGDHVRVEGDEEIEDGVYEVVEVDLDESDLIGDPRLKISECLCLYDESAPSDRWVSNKSVVGIVS